MPVKVAVVTISDRCSRLETEDRSGPCLTFLAEEQSFEVVDYEIIPDNVKVITDKLIHLCDSETAPDFILTTGGTGFSPRDHTPEATKQVIEKEATGITIALITGSLKLTPMAMTSRLTAGIRGRTCIINFPGSPKACKECFSIVVPVFKHCKDQMREDTQSVAAVHSQIQNVEQTFKTEAAALQLNSSVRSLVHSASPRPADRHRTSPYPMVEVNSALKIIYEAIRMNPGSGLTESVAIKSCEIYADRILAEDVVSKVNLPPFPASVKDGYAVVSYDGAGIRQVVSCAATAGIPPGKLVVTNGTCVRISTGAPIPLGADCVVQVEDTALIQSTADGEELQVDILEAPSKGQDIRPIGCDIKKGDHLLDKGSLLGPIQLALCASVGLSHIQCATKVRIGLLSSGDELVEAGQSCSDGQIWDSNKTCLRALLNQHHFETTDWGIVKDVSQDVYSRMLMALRRSDVLITTGGVSMGEKDLIKQKLELSFKAKIHFGRVNMKPGKPTTFATCDFEDGTKKYIFALPGNPVSAYVTCMIFVLPALRLLSSGQKLDAIEPTDDLISKLHKCVPVTMKTGTPLKLDPRPEYARAHLTFTESGVEGRLIPGSQMSSRLLSAKNADALVILPSLSTFPPGFVNDGDRLRAIIL